MIFSILFVVFSLCCVSGVINILGFLNAICLGFNSPSLVLFITLLFLFVLLVCSIAYSLFDGMDAYSRIKRGRAGTDDKYFILWFIVKVVNFLFGFFLLNYYLYCNL